jgi:hypothetical protein
MPMEVARQTARDAALGEKVPTSPSAGNPAGTTVCLSALRLDQVSSSDHETSVRVALETPG